LFAKQLIFFKASSFYPGRGNTGHTLPSSTLFLQDSDQLNSREGESDAESNVADWLDEPAPEELAPTLQQPQQLSNALALEVGRIALSHALTQFCFL
jgi:hypothetical protein